MSFIYKDEDLISQLLAHATEFENKFNKQGQMAAVPGNVEFQNLLNLSDKMIDQLKGQYFPEAPNPDASDIQTSPIRGPSITDLNTLGNFLEYMAGGNIKINNDTVVYFGGQEPPNKQIWLPVNAERAILAQESIDKDGNRQALRADYYVHKDFLGRYLTQLSSQIPKADPEKQKLMKTLLSGLMDTVNRMLRTKLTPDYQKPEEKFVPTTQLDSVPNPFDPKNPYQDGTYIITVADLQSPGQFNAWLGKETLILADGTKSTMAAHNLDRCYFLNGLHTRAKRMSQDAIPANESRMAYYVKMVEQLADQSKCALNGAQQQSGGPAPKVSNQQINQIISVLPYVPKFIDFARIERFFKAVSPVLPHVPQAASHIAEVTTLMQQFSGTYMANNDRLIPLGITVNQFANMFKDKETPGHWIEPAVDTLAKIIDSTRSVVDLFWSQYGDRVPEAQQDKVIEQIGEDQSSTSLYSENAVGLSKLRGQPSIRSNK